MTGPTRDVDGDLGSPRDAADVGAAAGAEEAGHTETDGADGVDDGRERRAAFWATLAMALSPFVLLALLLAGLKLLD